MSIIILIASEKNKIESEGGSDLRGKGN